MLSFKEFIVEENISKLAKNLVRVVKANYNQYKKEHVFNKELKYLDKWKHRVLTHANSF